MAILARVTRLFRADLNAILDQLEDPTELLRQSIREMQQALDKQRQNLTREQRELDLLTKRQQAIDSKLAEVNEQLDVCLACEEDDDLAKTLVRRKLQSTQQQEILAGQIEALNERIVKANTDLSANRLRLEEMQEKLSLVEPVEPAESSSVLTDPAPITEADIKLALLREKQTRQQAGSVQ